MTDYNYHSTALEGFNTNCGRVSGLSLWDISRNYFKNEAPSRVPGRSRAFRGRHLHGFSSLDKQRTYAGRICSCPQQLLPDKTSA